MFGWGCPEMSTTPCNEAPLIARCQQVPPAAQGANMPPSNCNAQAAGVPCTSQVSRWRHQGRIPEGFGIQIEQR